MRIVTRISTGKILEMQSEARAGTLIANAVAQGIPVEDLLEEVVTPVEYRSRVAAQEPAKPAVDHADSNNLNKTLKAVLMCVAQVGGLNNAQIRTMFKNKYESLG
jgi:hypothetical protein